MTPHTGVRLRVDFDFFCFRYFDICQCRSSDACGQSNTSPCSPRLPCVPFFCCCTPLPACFCENFLGLELSFGQPVSWPWSACEAPRSTFPTETRRIFPEPYPSPEPLRPTHEHIRVSANKQRAPCGRSELQLRLGQIVLEGGVRSVQIVHRLELRVEVPQRRS